MLSESAFRKYIPLIRYLITVEPQVVADGRQWLFDQWALPVTADDSTHKFMVPAKSPRRQDLHPLFFVNHSDEPNVKIDHGYIVTKWAIIVEITAMKDIFVLDEDDDVELFRNYFIAGRTWTYMVRPRKG